MDLARIWFLKSRIECREGQFEDALESITEACRMARGNVLYQLWRLYCRYLWATCRRGPSSISYLRELALISLELETIIKALERDKSDIGRSAYRASLEWLGILHFRRRDFLSAWEQFEALLACLPDDPSERKRAIRLAELAWQRYCGPSLWKAWFRSPRHLMGRAKFTIGLLLLLVVGFEIGWSFWRQLFHVVTLTGRHHTISLFFDWHFTVIVMILAGLLLLLPVLRRFSAAGFEFELPASELLEPSIRLPEGLVAPYSPPVYYSDQDLNQPLKKNDARPVPPYSL